MGLGDAAGEIQPQPLVAVAGAGGVGVEELPGLVQGFGREVGPIGGREIEFAVGALEGQVVADTLLAAGADDEVRVRLPRGIQA